MAAVAIKQHANGAMNRDKRAFFALTHLGVCVVSTYTTILTWPTSNTSEDMEVQGGNI